MENWKTIANEFIVKVLGSSYTILWERQTRYCGILAVSVQGIDPEKWVVKVIMPELSRQSTDESLVAKFNELTLFFREQLAQRRVPLARRYLCKEMGGYAIQASTFEGIDCEQLIRSDPKLARGILHEIMTATFGVLHQDTTVVGLDTQLSNFCLDCGRVAYTDVFPPLCVYQGTPYVHHPNPTAAEMIEHELKRKFRPFGILRRLRFSLLSIDPSLLAVFEEALDCLDDPLLTEMRACFEQVPNGNLKRMSEKERLELIRGLPESDVDSRREIASLLIPTTHPDRKDILQEVFCLTSTVPLPDLPPLSERLAQYEAAMQPFLR